MAMPTILPAGRRSCEENRARRAWASAHGRQPATLRQTLRQLLPVLTSPRPVYGHIARRALASGDAEKMLTAINTVCAEIQLCRTERAKFIAYWHRTAA